jgi:tetratricopeptide (TPR) repeat protein
MIAGEYGRSDEARDILDAVVAGRPFDDGNDLLIPLHVAQLSEAAAAVGHVGAAQMVADVVGEFTSAIGLLATGHLCFGAVERSRGDIARTLGRLDDAVEHYERAIDIEEALGARVYANRSRLGLARALSARGYGDDPERADAVARAVMRVAQELGTPMVAASAEALLA